ncbi:MAG: pseudouridine synthase [Clostridiales bacterium]|nr:pseudouridine synthase [Clostridiales bacterium]
MRIDKFLTTTGKATRREAAIAARAGQILVDGEVCRRVDLHIDPEKNVVHFRGEEIAYRRFTYIMLNKPDGYISATTDPRTRTVLDLLPPELKRIRLFPCGRLDKDTVGLLILTNNGQLAHRLLSPRHHVEKEYRFTLASAISEEEAAKIEEGLVLDDGYLTKPSKILLQQDRCSGTITITEGKFHQIKRMFRAVGKKVVFLERICFAGIFLDSALDRGEWRYLTAEEIAHLEAFLR